MHTMIWILFSLAALALLWMLAIAPRTHSPALLPELHDWLYAHRGFHDDALGLPENSLGAFRRAAGEGFAAELDVHLTKDGQLAVMHDESLLRMCGVDRRICDCTSEELRTYKLGNTQEGIPFLEDVLPYFENSAPLLIELKTCGKNAPELCARVMRTLDDYTGMFCIESFDPRVLIWFRRNRPKIVRGQLSTNYTKHNEKLNPVLRFLLHNYLLNFIAKPDFLAYNIEDYRDRSINLCRKIYDATEFSWTVRNKEQQNIADAMNSALIFELFDPRKDFNAHMDF